LLSNELSKEMNLYQAAAYARHLLIARSTEGYGVHSPYAFDFLNSVVKSRTDEKIVKAFKGLRREMLHDERIITVTDMGAGSARKKERKISDIAGRAALPCKYALLLSRMVQGAGCRVQGTGFSVQGSAFNVQGKEHGAWGMEQRARGKVKGDGIILEFGTSLGLSALAMALAAPDRRVVTVEGCPALAAIASENLKRYGAYNAEVLNMEFSAALDKLEKENIKIVFAFIDGNHKGAALMEYVSGIMKMGDEVIITSDDIHHSKDMFHAWRTIISSDSAATTMEIFRFGIIFRLHSLTPAHYRIRY
jgi:precorrin-6B methylase 2